MNIFKILLTTFSIQTFHSQEVKTDPIIKKKTSKNSLNSFFNKLKKIIEHIKKEQKFFEKIESGHNLKNLDKIKIGMNKEDVVKLLGQPVEIKCIKNSYYYIAQTINVYFTFKFFKKGKIIKIIFKDEKVSEIKEINMKQTNKNTNLYLKLKNDIKNNT